MIDALKEAAPYVGALIALIAGWWAWKTSYLKTLSDRVTHLEGKVESLITICASKDEQIAKLTGALASRDARIERLEGQLTDAIARGDTWEGRYNERHRRHQSQPGLKEDSDEALALDEIGARQRRAAKETP